MKSLEHTLFPLPPLLQKQPRIVIWLYHAFPVVIFVLSCLTRLGIRIRLVCGLKMKMKLLPNYY